MVKAIPNGHTLPPPAIASAAGLRYVSDEKPGLTRRASGKSFRYLAPDGKTIRDRETLRRIRALVIPPAWEKVWICPLPNGHIQAIGRDVRGRKQYRYHDDWRQARDEGKFERILIFAKKLPAIRRQVARDLRKKGMSREKVLAAVIRLLETTLIRVGNDEYARTNKSFGLTTLRNRHANVRGARITFDFVGKSGKRHQIDIEDPHLAKLVRRCQDLPGQELFGFVDAEGTIRDVTSQDVNAYLQQITGQEFSAKDFRTWAGTVLAAIALKEFSEVVSRREAKRNVSTAIEAVAKMLGNTPTICRKCYVHPAVLESYLQGQTIATLRQNAEQKICKSLSTLRSEEAAVLMLLRERLTAASRKGGPKVMSRVKNLN